MRIKSILFFLICSFLFICSDVFAYQSILEKTEDSFVQQGDESSIKMGSKYGLNSTTEGPGFQNILPIRLKNIEPNIRTESTISIDSIQYLGGKKENTAAFVNLLNGLKLIFSSQAGDTPIQTFELKKDNSEILSYSGQITEPYLVNINLLGMDTYLIRQEDQFEEKLAASIYGILGQMTDNNANLPDLESVYTMIRAYRASINTEVSISTDTEFSYDRDLNVSAFEIPLLSAIMKLHQTENPSEISYHYTDFPPYKREYTWPEISSLPPYNTISSSISGTFTSEDILLFVNAFPQFFTDNPEFAALMNEQIRAGLIRSNPELAAQENTDYLSEIISGMQQTVQREMQDKYYQISIDQDEKGDLLRFTIESVNNNDPQSDGLIFTYQKANDENASVFELSLDSINRNGKQPICRTLGITNEGTEPQLKCLNMRFDDNEEIQFEFRYSAEHSTTSEMSKSSDITIEYDWKGQKGNAKIKTNMIPNQYGFEDSFSQISYTHTTKNKPILAIEISSETKTNEPMVGFDAANAIPASQLTQEDYDQIASQFFLQIMMLAMNMM